MLDQRRRLLVTDLDNTLWDWFEAWYQSFTALLDGLVELSGVDRLVLEEQVKAVHEHRGTTEYSNLIREVPALVQASAPDDPVKMFDAALHAQNSVRKATTQLYPGVAEALNTLRDAGVRIVAYTESGAYWTEWRIRRTGLDGLLDVLYSAPDHDLTAGINPDDLRTGHYSATDYGLTHTQHLHVPHGVLKPNAEVLLAIVKEQGFDLADTVYIGDSLTKDVVMAQSAGITDVHAQYGVVQHLPEYNLLRRLTHWTDEDVARERDVADSRSAVTPTHVCPEAFSEVLPLLGLR